MSKNKEVLISIGNYIGKKVRSNYKSNVEFANACDISEGTVRRILLGQQNISIKVLRQICEALDIKMSDLLKETGN